MGQEKAPRAAPEPARRIPGRTSSQGTSRWKGAVGGQEARVPGVEGQCGEGVEVRQAGEVREEQVL